MIVLVKLDFHGNNVSLRRKNLRNVVTIVMNKVIYYLKKEDPYDEFAVCPKCKTMIVMDFDENQLRYDLKDIFKVDLVSHIDKAWHILNKFVLKSERI